MFQAKSELERSVLSVGSPIALVQQVSRIAASVAKTKHNEEGGSVEFSRRC
jgi:hypothetical protein